MHHSTWRAALAKGVYRTDARRIDRHFRPAYEWMRQQLIARIGRPPTPIRFPVWAWYQSESAKRRRPDLRTGGHLKRGAAGVPLEFESPDSHALLSDFELWHYALNDWYLPSSAREADRIESGAKPAPNAAARRLSWQRMFDLDWAPREIAFPRSRKSIQAVLWELDTSRVRDVRRFTAR